METSLQTTGKDSSSLIEIGQKIAKRSTDVDAASTPQSIGEKMVGMCAHENNIDTRFYFPSLTLLRFDTNL